MIGTSGSFISRTAIFNFSGVISLGRPPMRPRARAARNPAIERARIRSRSNSASAEKTWNWNSANGFILFGKGGELATNKREDQESAVLALHLLQICMVYINTLMLQQVLAEPWWGERMGEEDRRGLTPLFYSHVNPYGEFRLDMEERLSLS